MPGSIRRPGYYWAPPEGKRSGGSRRRRRSRAGFRSIRFRYSSAARLLAAGKLKPWRSASPQKLPVGGRFLLKEAGVGQEGRRAPPASLPKQRASTQPTASSTETAPVAKAPRFPWHRRSEAPAPDPRRSEGPSRPGGICPRWRGLPAGRNRRSGRRRRSPRSASSLGFLEVVSVAPVEGIVFCDDTDCLHGNSFHHLFALYVSMILC